ncbi:mavicyanin-like [Impatiens glandulifera]|uniref:mavicyanin-like n=1 Tax=Impatiens glandulifera TaxID=253017 RepID=UPI001FB10F3C|nr:mavicyanin-like [Impatiens glandulifera]
MASMSAIIIFLLSSTLFIASSSQLARSFDFEVGDETGWIVPLQNDTKFYNNWASENRFLVHDTLRFRYKKDSVMDVTEKEYKNCNSTRPISFSNTGNTVIELGHSGLFYFISGASGHCQRGQKMIVKVMSEQDDSRNKGHSSSASSLSTIFPLFVMSCYGGAAILQIALSHYFPISQAAP